MELHFVGAQYLGAQFGYHFSVDGHYTCLDEIISFTTAANTGVGKEFVQTDGLVGIVVLLFIFYTLLEAVLCIGIIVCSALTIISAVVVISATLLVTTLFLVSAALL